MIVIKAASVVEVHLLGLSPNHSCLKLKELMIMEVLILVNLCWLSVGLYTYLTLEN